MIDVLAFAFLVVMSELDNEVVTRLHLGADERPEVFSLVERTRTGTRLTTVVDPDGVRQEESLEIHTPPSLRRSGRTVV